MNMNLLDILKGLLNFQKKIDVKSLPSQGLFYNDDFQISIKRAKIEDIIDYEHNYIKDDIGLVITKLKKIVNKNSIFSDGYYFNDLKSIDIVFLFLEIVKFTKGKAISLSYFDDEKGKDIDIEFSSNYFNYFRIDDDLMKRYDHENKQFIIDDFKFSLPSIGVENCLTNYLIEKSNDIDVEKYNDYNYDFIFFLGNKKSISYNEIENLIQIFNGDIDTDDLKKIEKIISMFQPIQKYSLKRGNKVIEITSKIDLEKIWK